MSPFAYVILWLCQPFERPPSSHRLKRHYLSDGAEKDPVLEFIGKGHEGLRAGAVDDAGARPEALARQ